MDPVANMLTSIRNAQVVGKRTIKFPFSKLKFGIVKILEREGFIEKVSKKGRGTKKIVELKLKYENEKSEKALESGAISGLRKVSKPGQRIYLSAKEIKPVRNGYGIAIISTSQGLVTDKEARKKKIGGEIICEVW